MVNSIGCDEMEFWAGCGIGHPEYTMVISIRKTQLAGAREESKITTTRVNLSSTAAKTFNSYDS